MPKWGYDALEPTIHEVRWGFLTGRGEDRNVAYQKVHETAAKINAAAPSRWRKKPVLCPVTGEETHHPLGLSKDAWMLMADGVEFRRLRDLSERRRYHVAYFWLDIEDPLWPEGRHGNNNITSEFLTLVAGMMGVGLDRLSGYAAKNPDLLWLHEPPSRSVSQYPVDLYVLEISEQQAGFVRALGEKFQRAVQTASKQAFSAGSSWINRLADGSLSIDDTNRLAAERERAKS